LVEGEKDPEIAADVELLFERLDNRWNTVEALLARCCNRAPTGLRHVMAIRRRCARMTAKPG